MTTSTSRKLVCRDDPGQNGWLCEKRPYGVGSEHGPRCAPQVAFPDAYPPDNLKTANVGNRLAACWSGTLAWVGGRPGVISAATAATAILMVTLVRDHGMQYLLAATVLTGLIQIGTGLMRLGFVMRDVSKSVMTGFVSVLAILILLAQLPELDPTRVTWLTYVLVAVSLAFIYLFPYLTRAVPSPLVTIVVLTGLTMVFGWDVRTVGDLGALPDTLPVFLIPQIPLTFETLLIILPYSLAIAVVGLLESLMTQNLVDDLTDTKSDRNQECSGQASPIPPPVSSVAWRVVP